MDKILCLVFNNVKDDEERFFMKKEEKVIFESVEHKPVLISEVLTMLNVVPGGTYLDVTFGSGGHTRAILNSSPDVKIISLDWDKKSLEITSPKFVEEFGDRFKPVWGNFAHLYKLSKEYNFPKFDGILADFGTSQHQIFNYDGFSFRSDSPLDMRMSKSHSFYTAADIVNTFSKDKLQNILWDLGEETFAKKIVEKILEYRTFKKITLASELSGIIIDAKGYRGKTHPATKTFQALRIFVNNELENITSFLSAASLMLKPKGKLLCISFHSLEDRIVKDFFKTKEDLLKLKQLSKKPITASEEEMKENPSSRSAKLRGAEIL